ncbi:LOW QUALITY PROTEIN: hypothetical protein U9M48_002580 [Paspalum notatum var. saurae]|uniref:Uncharacterized protein n=1 Tax=Paspalum notatum var. saurae TaxID=547442 RepID=A0AAQ3PHX5_PASNO
MGLFASSSCRAQHHGLDSDSRPEPQHHPGPSVQLLTAKLVEHEDHRRTRHVPREPRLDAVKDGGPARVHRPEHFQPPSPPPPRPSGETTSSRHSSTWRRTKSGIFFEGQNARPASPRCPAAAFSLSGTSVCEADTISKSGRSTPPAPTMTAPEQRLHDERGRVILARRAEEDEAEVGAGHQHARAGVVLGDVPGDTERGGACGAAAEVQHGALRGAAEAQERGEAQVGAGHVRARVARTRWVTSLAGRPHSARAFAAAAAASSGTAHARTACRASSDGSARSTSSGWSRNVSAVWWKYRFLIPDTIISTVIPGPIPTMTPHSQSTMSPSFCPPSWRRRRRISSRTKKMVAPNMLPYSLRTCREAARFPVSSASAVSQLSKMARPPGCTAQKRPFQWPQAQRRQRLHQALLDGATEQCRDLGGYADVVAAAAEAHRQGALCPRQRRLRGGHQVEHGALGGAFRVGTNHSGARAIAEQRRGDEGFRAGLVRGAEGHARHQHARAAAGLREVPGHPERAASAVAAVEAEQRALHVRAQAEECGHAVVGARRVRDGVGGQHEVRDVGGRTSPLRDRPRRGRRGQLRHGAFRDAQPRVQRRRGAVQELRMSGDRLVRGVEMALLDARFLTCGGEVVAVGDTEVPVGVLVLAQAVHRVRRADGKHSRRTVWALRLLGLVENSCMMSSGSHSRRSPVGQLMTVHLLSSLIYNVECEELSGQLSSPIGVEQDPATPTEEEDHLMAPPLGALLAVCFPGAATPLGALLVCPHPPPPTRRSPRKCKALSSPVR